jgi:predicted acetyltransferase
MVGAVIITHYLNESLLLNDGHIGDGVRPSERKKDLRQK